MPDVQTLRTLKEIIDRAICREEGHNYEDIQLSIEGIDTNSTHYTRCTRCGDTRRKPVGTATNVPIRIDTAKGTEVTE